MLRETYGELVRVAASVSRTGGDAGDVLHAVLLDAIERNVADLNAPERRAWLRGALRRRAALVALCRGRIKFDGSSAERLARKAARLEQEIQCRV